MSLTPTTRKQDAAAKRALKGNNSSSSGAEQALRDRAGRLGRHFVRVTHNVMGVLEPVAKLEHDLEKYHPNDCSKGALSTYGAKYKLGANQTKAALSSPQNYVRLMCETTATLCALTVTNERPSQVLRQTMGIQIGSEWQQTLGLRSAKAEYFGVSPPSDAIYERVLSALFPMDLQKDLSASVGSGFLADSRHQCESPQKPFVLYDGVDAYLFQVHPA